MPSTDQGVNLERYMLVPRTLIFLKRENKVLLLKGASNKRLWANLYNGVGGHIELGEDILSAAKRELREETGLSSPNLFLCGIVIVNTQVNPGVCIFVFSGEPSTGDLKTSGEGNLEWVEFSQVAEFPLVSDLTEILPKIIQSKPGDPPFLAYSSYDQTGNLILTFA